MVMFLFQKSKGGKKPMSNKIITPTKPKPVCKPGFFTKQIGHTTYRVGVHFSETNTETARDKIVRLIRNGDTAGKAANP